MGHAWFLYGRLWGERTVSCGTKQGDSQPGVSGPCDKEAHLTALLWLSWTWKDNQSHFIQLLFPSVNKKRHDRVLYQVVLAFCHQHTIRVQSSWSGEIKDGIEWPSWMVTTWSCALTSVSQLRQAAEEKKAQPHCVHQLRKKSLSSTCAGSHCFSKEKRRSMANICTRSECMQLGDMARLEDLSSTVVPLAMRDLGMLAHFRKELKGACLAWSAQEKSPFWPATVSPRSCVLPLELWDNN